MSAHLDVQSLGSHEEQIGHVRAIKRTKLRVPMISQSVAPTFSVRRRGICVSRHARILL
jgi:hypothetical protein